MKIVWSSPGTQLLSGYLASSVSIMCSALSASCVQALRGAIPDFQLSAIRSIVQALTYLIGGLLVGTNFKVGREYIPGLIYYGANFLFFNTFFFGASAYLPLAELQGVVTIFGVVFAILHSRLLFNVDIAKSNIIAAVVCVVGIALTAQPAWLFKKMSSTSDTATTSFMNTSLSCQPLNTSTNCGYTVSNSEVLLGYTFAVLSGVTVGVSFDINGIVLHNVKLIPKATYTMLVSTVGSFAFMFYFEDPVYMIDLRQFMLVLGHSLISVVISYLAIYAAHVLPGASLSLVLSFKVVTMLIAQYTIMHSIRPGNYNWIEVLGCIIIVFGASIPGVKDLLVHKAKANELP